MFFRYTVYMDASQLHTLFLIIHLLGVTIGAGGAFFSDGVFFTSIKDRKISKDEFGIIKYASQMTWVGLTLLLVSGAGLFGMNTESLSNSVKFLVKMSIVGVLLLNGVIFHIVHLPFIGKHIGEFLVKKNKPSSFKDGPFLLFSGVISVTSWIFALVLGALGSIPFSYLGAMSIYIGIIALGTLLCYLMFSKFLDHDNKKTLVKITLINIIVVLIFFGSSLLTTGFISKAPIVDEAKIEVPADSYSRDDVALHNNSEDCWLIVDEFVFNVTTASKLHPALFNCGSDASENYHKNHGTGIRDKMMAFKIGTLNNLKGVHNSDIPFTKAESLNPKPELYAVAGSWDNKNLIVVVEKDAEKLLFIDGTTHEPIGRIHDIGFQPHTSVFSPDEKYMYIISRDGWLTKINLNNLDIEKTISVGENSRGTALTEDGKYIAIGNYEPGNVVILDAYSMEILKVIPLIGEKDGKSVSSRAGALVESGQKIIVALKDLTSVWIIDTDQDFKVTNKFGGIGNNIPALHDGYVTPKGKHFIVSSQGSKTVWVLDTETMKPIAEIETGETPHTGPGATWGDTTYIPALGEGLITAIDMNTWKVKAKIKTGGPGLFIRSYLKDPSYPYVWADTAFGDHNDEIYVIDARVNKIIKTLKPVEGEGSWHPEFTYDGKFVYIVSQTANEITVYDSYTFEVVKRITANTPSAVSNVGLRIEELGL